MYKTGSVNLDRAFGIGFKKVRFLFVCGDAKRMAKDVDLALREVVCKYGKMSETEAETYLKRLRSEKRYVQDVY